MIKKHLAIYALNNEGGDVHGAAREVENYYRQVAHKVWDVQVRGYHFEANCNPKPPSQGGTYCAAEVDAVDTGDFDPNYKMVWGGFHNAACGHATLGGNRSVTYRAAMGCGVRTMIHEWGHNLNRGHAGSLSEGGTHSEYGDYSSTMGRDDFGLNAVDWYGLGLPAAVLDLNGPEGMGIARHTFRLVPLEMPLLAMFPGEFNMAIADNLYLSLRKVKGWPYPQPSEQGLYIHRGDTTRRNKSTRLQPLMFPGDSRMIDGIVIDYHDYNNETATVGVML